MEEERGCSGSAASSAQTGGKGETTGAQAAGSEALAKRVEGVFPMASISL